MPEVGGFDNLGEWIKDKVDYLVRRREHERLNNTSRAARRECARCKMEDWWENHMLRISIEGVAWEPPLAFPPMPRHTCQVSVRPPRHTCHLCSHQFAAVWIRYCAPCKAAGRMVTYCDQDCQRKHWRAGHKDWCENSQIQILASVGLGPGTRTHSSWTEEQLRKVAELVEGNPSCEQAARQMRRLPSPSRRIRDAECKDSDSVNAAGVVRQ